MAELDLDAQVRAADIDRWLASRFVADEAVRADGADVLADPVNSALDGPQLRARAQNQTKNFLLRIAPGIRTNSIPMSPTHSNHALLATPLRGAPELCR